MTNIEFVKKCIDVATKYKTLYVMGCFGAPMRETKFQNVTRYTTNHSYNKKAERTKMIKAVADSNPPVFGFDCVCFIKGLLWGWNGNAEARYGGASYASNGVPDKSADGFFKLCKDSSKDFSNIKKGEAVWMSGHIGVYIGDGLAVECTPAWDNNVQITAVGNIGSKEGYPTRKWTSHGFIPYLEYVEEVVVEEKQHNFEASVSFVDKDEATKAQKVVSDAGISVKVISTKDNTPVEPVVPTPKPEPKPEPKPLTYADLKKGDAVRVEKDAPVYGKTYGFSKWVYTDIMYVKSKPTSKRIVITRNKSLSGTTGAIDVKYLTKA